MSMNLKEYATHLQRLINNRPESERLSVKVRNGKSKKLIRKRFKKNKKT